MRTDDFFYHLPEECIAQYPLAERAESRLMGCDPVTNTLTHHRFSQLPELLSAKDLLIVNDTQVVPARLHGVKASGGKIEVLYERSLTPEEALVHIRASHGPRPGSTLWLSEGQVECRVLEKIGALYKVQLLSDDWPSVLKRFGEIPLPPYITRQAAPDDQLRYQTVYAKHPGAIAAPTAGLHFDETVFSSLAAKGIAVERLTLHVGAGTFQPVRVDDIRDHVMHEERFTVSSPLCERVQETRARGGRVVAVGTTVVRALESSHVNGCLIPQEGSTRIFITPGYSFQIVDAMITNFHLPKSTLLMLVSAFAGKSTVMHAYNTAISEGYRFFSYGDAMFLSRRHDAI